MQHQEGSFQGHDQTELYYQHWRSHTTPQATMLIVHGFGEHSGRYDSILRCLGSRGINVYSFDQRGHGRSPGQRGHVNTFSEYTQDVAAFVKIILTKEPDLPFFLLGQSMGGLIVLNYAIDHPEGLSGVIAMSPHLSDPPIAPLLITMSQMLSRVWPSFSMSVGLDTSKLSRDQRVVQAYRKDPLVHEKASARLGTELSTAVTATQARASELKVPLLMMHGAADQITDPVGSQRFFEQVTIHAKQRILYVEAYHELHNDIHRERVVIDLAHWLEAQVERITTERTENKE